MSDYPGALKIDPEALRRRSRDIPDCSEIPVFSPSTEDGVATPHPDVVSFAVGEQTRRVEKLARVTVYCQTGTVAIARILLGSVRQTFRRNITSLDVVEGLLRSPPTLTVIDKSMISLPDEKSEKEDEKKYTPVRETMELINVGAAILQGEHEALSSHLQCCQPAAVPISPYSNSSLHYETSETSTEPQGMEFQFSLPQQAMKQVDKCLSDITDMGRLIKGVSTSGKGAVFLYGNGGVAFTPAIPRALHHRLSQLRDTNDKDSRPAYVSLGTRDRFFISFRDGSFSLKGPKALDKELRQSKKQATSVAFGVAFETFFVVYADGSWTYKGKGIPPALQDKLAARQDRPDLVCVNLGPSGEWFLRARNGRLWWGGTSMDMDNSIQELLDAGHYLNFLDFGEDSSYIISYD